MRPLIIEISRDNAEALYFLGAARFETISGRVVVIKVKQGANFRCIASGSGEAKA